MKKCLLLYFLFMQLFAFAQKEGNIWYFGQNAGIDFNSGTPVALTNGELNTWEGNASICDSTGALLFYTDGITVWNKNHKAMINGVGLMGSISSTQSAVIVKRPGLNTIYYIFTVDEFGLSNGLRYSEVNMNLNGGLGGITVNKNIPIVTPICEKIVAIKHQNDKDFWIVTHLFGSDTFHSYLLTSAGINATPVLSKIGTQKASFFGYLKASSNGKRIASANGMLPNANVEVFDFDNKNGILKNKITLNNFSGTTYGLEFSPNNNVLYVTEYRTSTSSNYSYIHQYNMLAGPGNAILNSQTIVGRSSGFAGALQLAPDGKIYMAQLRKDSLGLISNPDSVGMACNYVNNGFYLAGKLSEFGLPNFYNSIYENVISFTAHNFCSRDSTVFYYSSSNPLDSVLWNFDDVISGDNDTSRDSMPTHVFSQSGNYYVSLITYSTKSIDTVYKLITIIPLPIVYLGNDTTLCLEDALILDVNTPNANYKWQNNTTESSLTIVQEGNYWVTVTQNSCSAADSIYVKYNPLPSFFLGKDTILCPTEKLLLDASTISTSYLWQDNSTNVTFEVVVDGMYWVKVTLDGCSTADSIEIKYMPIPMVDLGNDTLLCVEETLLLDIRIPNASYLWQDNSTNPTFSISQEGKYWVTVVNSCGNSTDTINISTKVCNCHVYTPNAFSPNADNRNDQFVPISDCVFEEYHLLIFNRWGEKLFETNDYTQAWDGTFQNKPCPIGAYAYLLFYKQKVKRFSVNGNVTLLK